MKKIVWVILGMCLILTGCKEKEKAPIPETGGSLLEEKTVEGLKFSPLHITTKEQMTELTATVTNTLEESYSLKYVHLTLFNNKKEKLLEADVYIGTTIAPKETNQLLLSVTKNLTEFATVEYTIVK